MEITTRDMRILELNCVAIGIPLRLLMEAAGKSVADEVVRRAGSYTNSRVIILAGKGGNGGDGLVAARYLASRGFKVTVYLAYDPKLIDHPDTKFNYEILSRMGSVEIVVFEDHLVINESDIIIDALLGTGVKGEIRDPLKRMIEESNNSIAKLRVAVDTPSGLNPDTGEVHGIAFKADLTITFHGVKPGLLKRRDLTGEIIVANIGVPPETWIYAGPGDVEVLLPKRPRDAHKGSMGKIMVIGGSNRFTGAPTLAALASLASGADLAYIVTPTSTRNIIASYSPEIITLPYDEPYLKPSVLDKIIEYIDRIKPHVLIIGPGLGDEPDTLDTVSKLIDIVLDRGMFAVIDADALKTIKMGRKLSKSIVITPHRGEFMRIYGGTLFNDPFRDAEIVKRVADDLNTVILLKAPVDIVSDGVRVKLNRTGNPYMSIGGTGDVLTGIVAVMIAQIKDTFIAAYIGAYINGLAGDYLLKNNRFVSPLEIIKTIPSIIRKPLDYHRIVYLNSKD
ncbi:MAG: NAD(P)H-hydrate dehydratase [Desulfurococcaceae archaeon]